MDMIDLKQTCFWCEAPATVLLEGAPFCAHHARCFTCGQSLTELIDVQLCVCADYGSYGHEDALFCGLSCMEAAHPADGPDEVCDEC